MPLAKCARCDRLFDKAGSGVCPGCVEDEEKDHALVRDCLKEQPDANAEIICELTGVSIACISRMLDSGMISTADPEGGSAKCGQCGAPAISATKRLCHPCLEKLNQSVAKQRKSIKLDQRKKTEVGDYGSVRRFVDEKRR